MPTYRCYFLDREDHIGAAADIEAAALSETVTKALGMLKIRPQFDDIEIWQGTHRLYPEPAADKVASGNVCSGDHAAAHVPAELRAIAKAPSDAWRQPS